MKELRQLCINQLDRPIENQEASNAMWDKRAAEFHMHVTQGIATEDPLFQFAREHMDLTGATMLDVGCGTGRYLKMFLSEGVEVEGLEPSTAMKQQAEAYLEEHHLPVPTIYSVAFQDFVSEKRYDYVFLANTPVYAFYENYLKLLSLSHKGLLVGVRMAVEDQLLSNLAERLDRPMQPHASSDLVYFFNLLLADGYYPDFKTHVIEKTQRVEITDCVQRYTSWLYGVNHTSLDQVAVAQAMEAYAQDGHITYTMREVLGLLYVDKTKMA